MTFYAEFIKKNEKSHFEELIPKSKFDFTFADFSAVESFCGMKFDLTASFLKRSTIEIFFHNS